MTNRVIDYGKRGRVVVVPDADSLANEAAQLVCETTKDAVSNRGYAFVALSGGSTPKKMGDILGSQPLCDEIPWGSTHVFWGDERWVPLESPESNAGEAKRGFLDNMPIPNRQIHPFTISGEPVAAATVYEDTIKEIVPGEPIPMFDLILLGMGDDGHTASLFPGTQALTVTDRLVAENDIEHLNATRLTFTAPLINAARTVAFLLAGEGKAARLAEVLDGEHDPNRLPSQIVRPTHGDLIWLVDEAAALNLSRSGA